MRKSGKLCVWIGIVLSVVGTPGAQAQPGPEAVRIRVDCREGIGLIPGFWRGLTGQGQIPEGVEVKTLRLSPTVVRRAWQPRLEGGACDWSRLDAALDTASARGIDVILPIPVPEGDALKKLWPELVFETSEHVSERVLRFEIWGGPGDTPGGDTRYLEYYEAAVWAIYRANRKARVGGPGASWKSRRVELLAWGCSDRALPLHFLSWRADSLAAGELRKSVDMSRSIVSRYKLAERPQLVVGGWSVAPDTVSGSAPIKAVRQILSVMDTDLAAVCLDDEAGSGCVDALRALQRLGLVRVSASIDPNSAGVDGIVSLDGEDVIGLFWRETGGKEAVVSASFSGMPNGSRVDVRRYLIGEGWPLNEPVEEQNLALQEPFNLDFPVLAGALTILEFVVVD